MANEYPFTMSAQQALTFAQEAAADMGHGYVGTEHLLIGLLRQESGVAAKFLAIRGLTLDVVLRKVRELLRHASPSVNGIKELTPRTKRVIELSFQEARRLNTPYIGTEHLLLALVREGDSLATKALNELGFPNATLYTDLSGHLGGDSPLVGAHSGNAKRQAKNTPVLNQFGRDLTALAQEGKFDPCVGREKEIDRIIQILSRRTKNNPCLIGEPGVGKTAIVEGLAQRIVEGNIPEVLRGKRVFTLDLSSMVAGAKYRGEFEERIKKAMEEVIKAGNVILFIDEMHTIIGAGAAEGAIDASNIMKPSLARGELQIIGATTLEEYRKHVEKDAALERRFQPIKVGEPSVEECILILKGVRDKYEAHHGVKITDEALVAAATLSDRYISDRFLPDKAIDLIDEAASRLKLNSATTPPSLRDIEKEYEKVKIEKSEAVNAQNFEKASLLHKTEIELKARLETEREDWKKNNISRTNVLTEEEIAGIASDWTGIPVKRIAEQENERLQNMESILHKRVIGQTEAVSAVAKAIRRGRVGLSDPKRPIGSFIFLGPTGVGKTELTRALAEALFGDENATIRMDMSEYMEKHSVSRLIGSPPGYVGYEEGGQLTEKVRRKPYSVILFDEIEKAHPDVFNVLLQILEDGVLTDGQGRKVNFKNTILIMTSNVGARLLSESKRMGFGDATTEQSHEKNKQDVLGELKKAFRPEFLNRLDEIIVFHQLSKGDILKITRIMLDTLIKRVENTGITLQVSDRAVEELANQGFDPTYGARPLRRAIQSKVEDLLADNMLNGAIRTGDAVSIDYENGEFKAEKAKSF